MVVTLSKNTDIEELKKKFLGLKNSTKGKSKSLDVDKYAGKVQFDVDGLAYQKEFRNEWK